MSSGSAEEGHVATAELNAPILDYSTPGEQKNVERVTMLYDRVLNGRNLGLVDDHFADDFVQHNTLFGGGRKGFAEFVEGFFFKTFPNLTVELELAVAQNDRVLAFTTWRGTGPAPDEEELELGIADLYRLRDGKLAEHWDLVGYDALEAFGVTRPEQAQPDTQPDHSGTEAQRRNLARLLEYTKEITIQDTSRAHLYIAEDFIQHDPMIKSGLEGFRECCQIFQTLAPDMAVITHHVVVGTDYVGAIWDWNGHQAGSGNDFILPGADIYRLENGMLTEHWDRMDYSFVKAALGFHPKAVFG